MPQERAAQVKPIALRVLAMATALCDRIIALVVATAVLVEALVVPVRVALAVDGVSAIA